MMTPAKVRLVIFIASMAAGMTLAVQARADDVTLSWSQPTTDTGGNALTGTRALTQNRVQRGTCSGTAFGTAQQSYTVQPPATSFIVPNLDPGTYCFRVFASNAFGESAASSTVQKVIVGLPPNPPTGVTVTATLVELRRTQSGGYWVARAVGYAPKGSNCYGPKLLRSYRAMGEGDPAVTITVNPSTITGVVAGDCV